MAPFLGPSCTWSLTADYFRAVCTNSLTYLWAAGSVKHADDSLVTVEYCLFDT